MAQPIASDLAQLPARRVGPTARKEDQVFRDKIKIKEPTMAYIDYIAEEMIPPDDRVPDQDNILRIHGVHSRTMRLHYDLYKQLMYSKGPLTRVQREMIAVVVSAENRCRY
jgi:alkylhydroperoxidase family enzyme